MLSQNGTHLYVGDLLYTHTHTHTQGNKLAGMIIEAGKSKSAEPTSKSGGWQATVLPGRSQAADFSLTWGKVSLSCYLGLPWFG